MSDYCECGMANNDPDHGSWHGVLVWNAYVFERARLKKQEEFDEKLYGKKPRAKRPKVRYVPLPEDSARR